jgi:hypothetical protein
MATQLLLKKSNVIAKAPLAADLEPGELAINYQDGVLYYKRNDGVIDIIAQKQLGGSSGIQILPKFANYTLNSGDYVFADTSAGQFTITLPITPVLGDFATIFSGQGWDVNPLILDGNGETIEGSADDETFEVPNLKVELVFDGYTWQVYAPIDKQYVQSVVATTVVSDIIKYAIALG